MTVPLVGGLAYRERLQALPPRFNGTLHTEPGNPYNPCAIAVHGPTGKVGYVAPEIARHVYDRMAGGEGTACVVVRGDYSPTTGILALIEVGL
jgi:hypothetical protein